MVVGLRGSHPREALWLCATAELGDQDLKWEDEGQWEMIAPPLLGGCCREPLAVRR